MRAIFGRDAECGGRRSDVGTSSSRSLHTPVSPDSQEHPKSTGAQLCALSLPAPRLTALRPRRWAPPHRHPRPSSRPHLLSALAPSLRHKMPWAYAVPLGVGLVAVAAVAVILIEVVPAVLEERRSARSRRRDRGPRRLAKPVRHRAETPPPAYDGVDMQEGARTSGVEIPEGGWRYEVRRRKGAAAAARKSGDTDDERYRLEPLPHAEPQHVLGESSVAESDFALSTHDDSDDEVPLSKLTASHVAPEVSTPARSHSRAASDSAPPSEPGTLPFVSPPLSTSSQLEEPENVVITSTPPPATVEAKEDPFADAAGPVQPQPLPDISSPLETSSPALSLASSFAPISPDSAAHAPLPLKHDSPASVGGWVLPSPAPSLAATLSDDDGWSRLSDEEDEWREVGGPATEAGGGLQLEEMGATP
ncbi:hypothetical protein DMC30DRAFT_40567 [Rhodotorula diobovata]|uniref:Uncharacterized protein n=1 Tax=Rhodotorula diobovata TaxID=5288 RepID=A0A5C5FQX4_9BASI|nr:hypothetical protein DMC30DRAFT_40567 [Rhodotorula diobovata]